MHTGTSLPLYSIATSTIVAMILALINIGSNQAFEALTSLTVASILLVIYVSSRFDPLSSNHWHNEPAVRAFYAGPSQGASERILIGIQCDGMGVCVLFTVSKRIN